MTYHGIVKQGKVELQSGATLPDGTPVRIETLENDWRSEWEALAEQVSRLWGDSRSALDVLAETRQ